MTAIQWTTWHAVITSALTPSERWDAMRQFPEGGELGDVFQIVGLIVLGVLVVLLVWIQYTQAKNRKKSCESAFDNCAEQRGLSDRERHTLMVLAKKAGLKRAESIFTIATAYDRGVERMLDRKSVV